METKVLFHCKIQVPRHSSKKNEKRIGINRSTSKMFILKSAKAISAENLLKNKLQIEKLKKRIDTITEDIIAEFTFYFPESIYYTKQNVRSKKLPDLSNLYELPQDCLQSTKIIENDTQIVSHGKSSREPINDNNYWLEIKLIKS